MELNKEALRYVMIIIRKMPMLPDANKLDQEFSAMSKSKNIKKIDFRYALKQAIDSGLIDGDIYHDLMDPTGLSNIEVKDLTPKGHEFIDSIIDDARWNKVKNYLKENGLPITITSIIKAIANVFL